MLKKLVKALPSFLGAVCAWIALCAASLLLVLSSALCARGLRCALRRCCLCWPSWLWLKSCGW